MNKVNWKSKLEWEFLNNLKILQHQFTKLGIPRKIEVNHFFSNDIFIFNLIIVNSSYFLKIVIISFEIIFVKIFFFLLFFNIFIIFFFKD